MSVHDSTYKNLVKQVVGAGEFRKTRSGLCRSLFGLHATYDLLYGFPLLTTKKVQFVSVVKELLWFLRGETNISTLGCGIWNAWARSDGECGPIYGKQWRDFAGVDQIAAVIESINNDPLSRRHIVSAWNPPELDGTVLPPCHVLFQFYVRNGRYLDCQLYQRSADLALGAPFNIASYALLMMVIARFTGYTAGRLHHVIGDAHVYENHTDKLMEQVSKEAYSAPFVMIDPVVTDWQKYQPEHFSLDGYLHGKPVKYDIAV